MGCDAYVRNGFYIDLRCYVCGKPINPHDDIEAIHADCLQERGVPVSFETDRVDWR